MKTHKNLEDVLKEKFEDLELPESPGSWEKINKRVKQKPATLFYPWMAAASIALLLLCISLFIRYQVHTPPGVAIKPVVQKRAETVELTQSPLAHEELPVKAEDPEVSLENATKQKTFETEEQVVFQTADQVRTFVLPDSSMVTLNRNSTLQLINYSNNQRKVALTGEGFFEVERSGSTFSVSCGNTTTEVLGTSFAICTLKDSIKLVVTSGKVKFDNSTSRGTAMVEAGKTAVSYYGNITVNNDADQNLLFWKTGVLHFQDASMAAVIQTLEKTFNVTIKVKDPALLNCHLNAKIKDATMEKALNIIKSLLQVSFTQQGQTYLLTGKGCM